MTRTTSGFTLLELLIVITIVGILATLLTPNLINARNRSYDAAATTCAKELLTQGEIYAIDVGSYVGFGGADPYLPRSCTNDSVVSFTIDTAIVGLLEGTVTSKSTAVFDYSNVSGINRQ